MNFSNNKAIYLQIADDINDLILTGKLKEDERIPSTRELSAKYQVNINTVMRTVEYLQSKEIIFNRRGIGYFVAPGAMKIVMEIKNRNFMDNEMFYFFRQLYLMKVEPSTLADLYKMYCASQKEDGASTNV